MCLIIAKPKYVQLPPKIYLENGLETNKDGIGVALHKDNANEIIIKKDFKNINDFYPWLINNVMIDDSLIIHFRLATSGLKDEGNRHPYPITKNKELLRQTNLVCQDAVAHNGVLKDYDKHEVYNDTQKFVLDILSDESIKNNLSNKPVQKLIKNFIGTDKLVIMFSTGDLIFIGEFVEENGVSYSNYGYRSSYRYSYLNNTTNTWSWCEHCLKMKEDSKELEFKKVKLRLCKECRQKLAKGSLDDYIEQKRNKSTPRELCYNDQVICCLCQQFVDKIKATQIMYGTWKCDNCENKDVNIKCDGCDKSFKVSELLEKEECLLCESCNNQLLSLTGVELKPKSSDLICDECKKVVSHATFINPKWLCADCIKKNAATTN